MVVIFIFIVLFIDQNLNTVIIVMKVENLTMRMFENLIIVAKTNSRN